MRFSCNKFITYGVTLNVFVLLTYTLTSFRFDDSWRGPLINLMGSRNVTQVVKPEENTLIIEPGNVNDGSRPFAVCLVTSLARNFELREGIRQSWKRFGEALDVRVYFTIGFPDMSNTKLYENLLKEQHLNDDLIVDNVQEGYYRLTVKMLRMLKWYNATFSDFTSPRFLIKTDDDVFLHLPNLAKRLKETSYYKRILSLSSSPPSPPENSVIVVPDPHSPATHFIGGKRYLNSTVDPDPKSKWHITPEERDLLNWHKTYYPVFVGGGMYVLSGNVVRPIYEASFQTPIFPFEDVYLLGMIANAKLHLTISHIDNILDTHSKWDWSSLANLTSTMITVHPIRNPTQMSNVCREDPSCKKLADLSNPPKLLLALS